jgi:hypothetical protein
VIRAASLLIVAACALAVPARAQPCIGLPLEAGDHALGALVETETGYTLIALQYAGSSRALAWRAHAGGVAPDFPATFPGDFRPAIGGGLAWVGWSRAVCPTIGVEYFDEDPAGVPLEPGDTDADVTTLDLGLGTSFSTPADSLRRFGAIVYLVPRIRWVRRALTFGAVEETQTDRQLAFEAGITAVGRRLWGGGGARVRYREENDYPLDAVLVVRGGLRW